MNSQEGSNSNGHYFSGKGSRFFDLLYQSGLITRALAKWNADEIVFGDTTVNDRHKEFGVVDLVNVSCRPAVHGFDHSCGSAAGRATVRPLQPVVGRDEAIPWL